MASNFRGINPEELNDNTFRLIGKEWMLITAGTQDSANTMTASWGGLGVLWNMPVCFVFVRPTRHTYQFMEKENFFSLSFFEPEYRDVLNYCGAHSGRDGDKIQACGLEVRAEAGGGIYFDQARLVILCEKMYFSDIDPRNFLDESIGGNYPNRDYHRMYVGRVKRVMVKE